MWAARRMLVLVLVLGCVLLLGGGASLAISPAARGAANALIRRATSRLAAGRQPDASAPPSSVLISVDPARVLRPISHLIYGVSAAGPDELVALGAQLNRWGGNPNSRYNWALGNAWNAARDYEFRNYGVAQADPAHAGTIADRFITASKQVGAETEITIPAIGWVARNTDKETRSIGVPDSGGPPLGLLTDAIAGYDPTANRHATSVPSLARKGAPFVDPPSPGEGPVFQDEWVHHLVDRFGTAVDGGVPYYIVDNEPDLWSTTHTDVHPVQPGYDDMLSTFLEYATAIKDVDPQASIAGPALSGWTGYFYSARDQGGDRYRTHADRLAHGDTPFLPWWLDQVRKHDEQTGRRSLDVLDVHYYPQSQGVFTTADDPSTRGLRLRSTRSLWDPTYVDESWIGEPVQLLPRMRAWLDDKYPGTLLSIGEWNWGGEQSMSGALAVADVLGIFGREGVDLAAYWTFPPLDSPPAQAFAMYTHYDAAGDAFGNREVVAEIDASADYATTYASVDSSNGDVTVIAINKQAEADVSATIRFATPTAGQAEVFRYAPGDPAIQDRGPAAIDGTEMHLQLPASSITLVRLRR